MANEVSLNNVPNYLLGGTIDVEVISPLVGRSIFDGLRRKLSTSGQMEKGDYFMDRSRELLRRHLQLIELEEQDTIRQKFDEFVIPSMCRSRLLTVMQQYARCQKWPGTFQWIGIKKVPQGQGVST